MHILNIHISIYIFGFLLLETRSLYIIQSEFKFIIHLAGIIVVNDYTQLHKYVLKHFPVSNMQLIVGSVYSNPDHIFWRISLMCH